MDDSAIGRYDMILGRDLLTELVLNLKLSNHIIEVDDEPFKVYTAPIVDLGTYQFTDLETSKITLKEFFINAQVTKVYESKHVRNSTERLHIILYPKYEKTDLN